MDEDLSRAFELTGELEDAGLDIEAIFQADAGAADTLPPFGEAEPASEASVAEDAAPEESQKFETGQQEAEKEPQEPATPHETLTEDPKADGEKETPPSADTEPEPDIFAAFAEDKTAPPAPKQEVAAAPVGQVSIFDKPPVFSYGGHKDKIEDLRFRFFTAATGILWMQKSRLANAVRRLLEKKYILSSFAGKKHTGVLYVQAPIMGTRVCLLNDLFILTSFRKEGLLHRISVCISILRKTGFLFFAFVL